MHFKAKKSYGNYKVNHCPFCDRIATQKNEDGLEVCPQHINSKFEEIKCTCGSWLEQRSGKFGAYFNCINCGNINLNKAMEIKEITKNKQKVEAIISKKPLKREVLEEQERKETTIDTNDIEFFS